MGKVDLEGDGHIQPEIKRTYESFVDAMRVAAVDVRLTRPLGMDRVPAIHYGIMGPEASAEHARHPVEHRQQLEDKIRQMLDGGETIPATDYIHAMKLRQETRRQWLSVFKEVDLLAIPTVPITAPSLQGESAITWPDGTEESVTEALIRWCVPVNIVGFPALSIPYGTDAEGQPVGIQLVARPDEDEFLLTVGQDIMDSALGQETSRRTL